MFKVVPTLWLRVQSKGDWRAKRPQYGKPKRQLLYWGWYKKPSESLITALNCLSNQNIAVPIIQPWLYAASVWIRSQYILRKERQWTTEWPQAVTARYQHDGWNGRPASHSVQVSGCFSATGTAHLASLLELVCQCLAYPFAETNGTVYTGFFLFLSWAYKVWSAFTSWWGFSPSHRDRSWSLSTWNLKLKTAQRISMLRSRPLLICSWWFCRFSICRVPATTDDREWRGLSIPKGARTRITSWRVRQQAHVKKHLEWEVKIIDLQNSLNGTLARSEGF